MPYIKMIKTVDHSERVTLSILIDIGGLTRVSLYDIRWILADDGSNGVRFISDKTAGCLSMRKYCSR